jgi:glycosyltransferase involved in cell wall biosynthesis
LKKNKITVFTITYNCEQYILRCYNTLLKQSYKDWVWLIIDDGSTDNSGIIIKNLNDDRITYFKIDINVGRGKSRNFGLSKVQTDWLVILDMDDLMLSTRLYRFNDSINNGYDGLISSTLLVDNRLNIKGIRKVVYNNFFNLFTHATLCIKTQILREIAYSESRYAEDQRVILFISNNCNLDKSIDPLYIYQEDASINVHGAYLSNYFAFVNFKKIIFYNKSSFRNMKQILYFLKFGLNAALLYIISKFYFGNVLYNKLIQLRSKDIYVNEQIQLELNSYVQ